MKYATFALLFVTFISLSEESFFELSISELISKTEQTDDSHYLSRAMARCSGLISLMHGVFTRDVPGTDFSVLEYESFALFKASYALDMKKLQSRGGKSPDQSNAIMERLGEETNAYLSKYSKWFDHS